MDIKPDETGCMGNTIITASGKYFDYVDPHLDQIDITDIAKALSNICRFGGHCDFYSVAEHSYNCYQLARRTDPDNLEFQKLAGLHDAAEAYIGDMCKPLKIMMPEFKAMEKRIEIAIALKFDLKSEYWPKVKHLDLCMLKAEKLALFPNDRETWYGFNDLPDIDIKINKWSPDHAAEMFLDMFNTLEIAA